MGTNIFDFDGVRYLAINRANQSSTIYTIDLKAENLEYDVFSFEGRYLSNLDLDNLKLTIMVKLVKLVYVLWMTWMTKI